MNRLNLSKKQRNILIVAGISLIVLAVVGYLLYRRHQKRKALAVADSQPAEDFDDKIIRLIPAFDAYKERIEQALTNPSGPRPRWMPPKGKIASFPLKTGKEGREVLQLQIYLNDTFGGFAPEQLTGVFDAHTQKRLEMCLYRDQMSERNFYKRGIDQIDVSQTKAAC